MSNRIVRPVRAWADYGQWSVYLEGFEGEWENVVIPKGDNDWIHERGAYSGITDFAEGFGVGVVNPGPLRSLRVLYENGAELVLGTGYAGRGWGWIVQDGDRHASGDFTEDKDGEAVERAMIAAAAFFTQAECV